MRELRNAIEHAVIVARGGVIDPEQLPEPTAVPSTLAAGDSLSLEATIAEQIRQWSQAKLAEEESAEDLSLRLLKIVEPPLLEAAMDHHGQCLAAARALGMHRSTLRKKLDQYGLSKGG